MIYELRTYWAVEGREEALENRFRMLTLGIFDRLHMQVIGFWKPDPVTEASGDFVYLLAFPDRDTMEAAWQAFRNDPEWLAGKAASESQGVLVRKITSTILTPTDYSPLT